jgi:S-methylmethionine-dependent homocysteine/selenocysteine methylase
MNDALEQLEGRLARGPVVLDGAVGTELERRGVPCPPPLWSADALLSAPAVVRDIHHAYVTAGADIIVADTFRTNPRTLRAAGRLADGPVLCASAVSLARRATRSHRDVYVAASVAPVEDCYRPDLVPPEGVLDEEHAAMMVWLERAEPDLIWIETMGTVREARAAARAASARLLPFAVSFVVQESGVLLGGEPLEDAVAAVEPFAPLAVGLNCIPPRGLTALLPRLAGATDRPRMAYGHIGNRRPIHGWRYAQDATPDAYAAFARGWLDQGVAVVGGCCGTSPAHIRAVRQAADSWEN